MRPALGRVLTSARRLQLHGLRSAAVSSAPAPPSSPLGSGGSSPRAQQGAVSPSLLQWAGSGAGSEPLTPQQAFQLHSSVELGVRAATLERPALGEAAESAAAERLREDLAGIFSEPGAAPASSSGALAGAAGAAKAGGNCTRAHTAAVAARLTKSGAKVPGQRA